MGVKVPKATLPGDIEVSGIKKVPVEMRSEAPYVLD